MSLKREKQRLRRGRVRGDHATLADEDREQGPDFRWLTLGYRRETGWAPRGTLRVGGRRTTATTINTKTAFRTDAGK